MDDNSMCFTIVQSRRITYPCKIIFKLDVTNQVEQSDCSTQRQRGKKDLQDATRVTWGEIDMRGKLG